MVTQRHLLPTAATQALQLVITAAAAAANADEREGDDGYRDPFEEVIEGSKPFEAHAPPASLLEFAATLAPVLKYYVVLLGLFALARFLNRMVEAEDALKEKELKKRPSLRRDLIESDEDDDDESDGESESERGKATGAAAKTASTVDAVDDDDVHEELITDGSKLVKMTESELTERRKAKKPKKNHPLFEGLQKIEEELKQKAMKKQQRKQQQQTESGGGGAAKDDDDDDDEPDVSWNELHQSMLKRYQQKFPEHGLRVQDDDDYDDEFKELLKKHEIDPATLRREVDKNK